jgi:hypothetical protein
MSTTNGTWILSTELQNRGKKKYQLNFRFVSVLFFGTFSSRMVVQQ